jgi:hypothetical protein
MTHLRQRMIEDMGIRNLADNTQSAYLQQIIAYAEHFHRSPEELGPETVRAYQLYLTNIVSLWCEVNENHYLVLLKSINALWVVSIMAESEGVELIKPSL